MLKIPKAIYEVSKLWLNISFFIPFKFYSKMWSYAAYACLVIPAKLLIFQSQLVLSWNLKTLQIFRSIVGI